MYTEQPLFRESTSTIHCTRQASTLLYQHRPHLMREGDFGCNVVQSAADLGTILVILETLQTQAVRVVIEQVDPGFVLDPTCDVHHWNVEQHLLCVCGCVDTWYMYEHVVIGMCNALYRVNACMCTVLYMYMNLQVLVQGLYKVCTSVVKCTQTFKVSTQSL